MCTAARAFSTNDTVPSLLDVKVAGGVATITLADERKRNALSSTLMAQLRDEIRRLVLTHLKSTLTLIPKP